MIGARVRIALAVAAVAAAVPSGAAAASTYSDSITGAEYAATSTEGKFAGVATGSLPGTWSAVVDHTSLSLSATPTAPITGGEVRLATVVNLSPALVTGTFVSGGTVQAVNPGLDCTNQAFQVLGALANVGTSASNSGTGSFSALLTHYRTRIFGVCVTYSASVSGSLSLAF